MRNPETLPIYMMSALTLEEWGWDKCFKEGVGGSETFHIEMALRLAKRDNIVISHCPLPIEQHAKRFGDVAWFDCRKTDFPQDTSAIIINCRNPSLFDREKSPRHKYYFVAQDVDYTWTERAMLNVDRYITLCHTHSQYTLSKYPFLRNGKVFLSSNGIRTDYINELLPLDRNPNRLFWASSPDRGLVCLLENWFRVRERFPNAELRIAYGFNNMDTIIRAQGPHSSLIPLRQELASLGDQPGVTWLGRLGQDKVFEEWLQAAALPYCSDWPETSMISIMEAMACGAIPVTTNHWAEGQHGSNCPLGYVSDGLPQKSELAKCMWLSNLYEVLEKSAKGEFDVDEGNELVHMTPRIRMMNWAREQFNWERIVTQYQNWIKEDSEAILKCNPLELSAS